MQTLEVDHKIRCFGGEPNKKLLTEYHDHEWGVPSHNEQHLFELLILEGMQAGLSWETILKKRAGYWRAFYGFDPSIVSTMSNDELENLCQNQEIIRNRLKIYSIRQNARIFIQISKEFGSFDHYVWAFVKRKPLKNHWERFEDIPTQTIESDTLSKDLKKRGMMFVGSTIVYSYMQAIGMVNDHLITCWRYE